MNQIWELPIVILPILYKRQLKCNQYYASVTVESKEDDALANQFLSKLKGDPHFISWFIIRKSTHHRSIWTNSSKHGHLDKSQVSDIFKLGK